MEFSPGHFSRVLGKALFSDQGISFSKHVRLGRGLSLNRSVLSTLQAFGGDAEAAENLVTFTS